MASGRPPPPPPPPPRTKKTFPALSRRVYAERLCDVIIQIQIYKKPPKHTKSMTRGPRTYFKTRVQKDSDHSRECYFSVRGGVQFPHGVIIFLARGAVGWSVICGCSISWLKLIAPYLSASVFGAGGRGFKSRSHHTKCVKIVLAAPMPTLA